MKRVGILLEFNYEDLEVNVFKMLYFSPILFEEYCYEFI